MPEMSEELYLEKMKIAERLQAVESTLLAHTTQIKGTMEAMQKVLDKHSEEIWGNSHPGLKTNVDRLIQSEGSRSWFLRALAAGLLGKIGLDFWGR